jgi:hypothetical protein
VAHVIGEILPLAVAAAISPFPIIGVLLTLVGPGARLNGPLFLLGWLSGLIVIGAIGLTLATAVGTASDGAPSSFGRSTQIVLGGLLVVFAVRQWRKRPKSGEPVPMPRWMSAVEGFSSIKAAGLGFALSAANPKNLILTLAATSTIASRDLGLTDQIVVYAIYGVIATIGVALPVVTYFALGDRSKPVLNNLRSWLALHNAAIMAVIFLVIGVKVLGQGIAGS